MSDERGEYEMNWIPEDRGDYRINVLFRKDTESVEKEKQLKIVIISPHLSSPLTAKISMQGEMTNNRWRENDIFHCRSRGSCSVNVVAESNREDSVAYWWIFPEDSIQDGKNPASIKLNY